MPAAPATLGNRELVQHSAKHEGTTYRNYSILYDPEVYASRWVAYPLNEFHMSGNSGFKTFQEDPDTQSEQTNTWSGGYGVSYSGVNYPNTVYARGHQIPAADRTISELREQTYYATNMTPQIQDGFNGSIWSNLETNLRSIVGKDTLYIVTGPVYQKVGGNEDVTTIVNTRDGKTLPVANYYYKVVLKVKWSGETVTSAKAIGFWYPHTDYPKGTPFNGNSTYTFLQSIDQIEEWTGLDFFVNLPDDIEAAVEADQTVTWDAFKNF